MPGTVMSHRKITQIKHYSVNAIAILLAVLFVRDVGAQTYVERVGFATGQYYGSSLMLSMIAEAGCRNYFQLTHEAYNSSKIKKQILAKLKLRIPAQDYSQLPGFLSKAEAEIKTDFGSVLKNFDGPQCLKVVPEFEKMFHSNKRVWDQLLN
jgi:uncharacterized membrane protein